MTGGWGGPIASAVLTLIGVALAAGGVGMCLSLVRTDEREQRTLAEGLPAEAVVLRAYQERSTGGDHTTIITHRAVLGFHTHDGREVHLDESGQRRKVGERVGLRYLPEHPDLAVTTDRSAASRSAEAVLRILGSVALIALGIVVTIGGLTTF
ncbi:DUF3592 domain-containing protein [Kitasatospora cheerisanensis]|uniref:DUF3592 domain-containing protein n=1 Tax=Kitasatospora cheerisanensis KCTC 2395 TaxID=1348663 RepID=A0A066YNR8_9ACTN|nr:DUF3592 domain-containing protein [Kitasatospora cheerisanensis]KDN81614.1 hypothetical protein KCH_66260 [Kitasatospora cheerisanensis KCTC 2395]